MVRAAEAVPVIPRAELFGPAAHENPQLSPDGARLAYLAPSPAGVQNVYVRSLRASDDVLITSDPRRPVRTYRWAEDSRHLLYFQDSDGDENSHLYLVDIESRHARDLTPFPGAKATALMTSPRKPHEIVVGLNVRDRRAYDAYRIDLRSGTAVLDTRNPGDVLSWTADADLEIRAATAFDLRTGATVLRVRKSRKDPWRDLLTWPFNDALMFGQINGGSVVAGFAPDGRSLYVVSTTNHDTGQLVRIDQDTGRELEVIAAHELSDVAEEPTAPDEARPLVMLHPQSQRVQAVGFEYTQREWQAVDAEVRADMAALRNQGMEFPLVTSRNVADTLWIVKSIAAHAPAEFYLYDRKQKLATPLFHERLQLLKYPLARVTPLIIPARDGLKLVSYLTLPPDRSGPVPLIVHIHGGPWHRDSWGFDPLVQLLANRGYAVLQVNFRGSTGFGKAFLNAGNLQFGRGMQDDVTDAVHWAIDNGFADRKRICVMGYSGGGYATLRALTLTPELYACGIDIVGPTDLALLMASYPQWWQIVKTRWRLRVGDVEHDPALNRQISPLYDAHKIRVPLFVAAGANDVRVTIRNADLLVAAVRERGVPTTYVVYQHEGHEFVRPQNNLDLFGRLEEFLAKTLGGRLEPWQAVPDSTAQVR